MDKEIIRSVGSFEAGINNGINPILLPPNQLANGVNTTVRGTFVHPRPPVRKMTLTDDAMAMLAEAFTEGAMQGGGYFRPDNGSGSLMAAIAGRIFQFTPSKGATADVRERTIVGGRNPLGQPQAWIWQAEKWAIWNDGISNPVFIDGTTSRRSDYGMPGNFSTTTAANFTVPAVGSSVSAVAFTEVGDLNPQDIFTITNVGTFQVVSKSAPAGPANVDFINLTGTPLGFVVLSGKTASWSHLGTELPPGRMGTYGLGRNAISLTDGRQFVMSDQVGGASGTQANNYRDAVLSITENLFLLGGGNFTVPGNSGDIRAMRFTATMDVSLGQGPLQVFTPNTVFSCICPPDRETWSSVTNPILTESVITNGGLSQWATMNVNNDILTRATDGWRSIKLSRRDTDTWGTTPISFEVSKRLDKDPETLLGYTSSIVFDNRGLLTSKPKLTPQGIYWQTLVPINFDPVSSLRGKAPSVYDALIWEGLNVFQLFVGQFSGVERAFAFCWNEGTMEFELYELLKSAGAAVNDDDGIVERRVTWSFETAVLFQEQQNQKRQYKQLIDGEMYVDKMQGQIDVQVYWKPDQWPCYVPWISFQTCTFEAKDGKLGFNPRMGLGEPPAPRNGLFCDEVNNRPLREFYNAQFKFVITGEVEFLGASFKCVPAPATEFAKPICQPVCPN